MPVFAQPAPAKINLYLHVRGKRPDGYHDLQSLVVFAELGDALTLDTDRPFSISVSGPFAGAIDGPNLVEAAATSARTANPSLRLGAFTLDKQLPVAAGIGGGSADAAAALRAIQHANRNEPGLVSGFDPWKIAERLGADVPVCLLGAPAVVTGTGTQVRGLRQPLPPVPIVLVNAGIKLATADVFRSLDAPAVKEAPFDQPALHLGSLADVAELARQLAAMRNDLEPPALRLVPMIGQVLDELRTAPDCLMARMSGSGPTCFGLFQSPAAAEAACALIAEHHRGWWVRASSLRSLAPPTT